MHHNENSHFSIVIVTHNSSKDIKMCLESILTFAPGAEVVVVDNGSTDATVSIVETYKRITCITNKKNKGFSCACHQGVRQTNRNYLLFLNPDAYLVQPLLGSIKKLFDNDPTIGVIGPTLRYPNGDIQKSVRHFPDFFSQLLIFLKVDHIINNLTAIERYMTKGFDYNTLQEVDQVMGACFITKRALWETIGGFDKRFFIWFEEVDYCYEIRKHNLKVLYAPLGPVVHKKGTSFSKISVLKKQFWYLQSMMKYFFKRWYE